MKLTAPQSHSPDHARGGVTHGGVFGLDELLVVVDAAIDFIVLFTCQFLWRQGDL